MSKGHFVNMCIVIIGFLSTLALVYLIVYAAADTIHKKKANEW